LFVYKTVELGETFRPFEIPTRKKAKKPFNYWN
jgi:hypothetical protein